MTKSDWDYRGLAADCYDLWFGDEPFWDQAFFHDRIRHNGGTALEIAWSCFWIYDQQCPAPLTVERVTFMFGEVAGGAFPTLPCRTE